MKIKLFLSILWTLLFYSTSSEIIDEKEICEKLSTDLLQLKELIAKSKAEYDKNTNNTGLFQGIKRFRLKGRSGLHLAKINSTSDKPLFDITLFAVNNQTYNQEITISDNEKRRFLITESVTRCLSPDLAYGSWRIAATSFSNWKDDEHTEIENKTYNTGYSVTDESVIEVFDTFSPLKVNVSALSKVKVTVNFYSYDSIKLYLVGTALEIRSEDFETSLEQSDDAVKAAAFEFFGSEYWINVTKENYQELQQTIDTHLGEIRLKKFPLVVKKTQFHFDTTIGKDEPL